MNLTNDIKELENKYSFQPDSIKQKLIGIPYIAAEIAFRQLFWRIPQNKSRKKKILKNKTSDVTLNKDKIISRLKEIGVREGALVMLHSSMHGLGTGKSKEKAEWLLQVMMDLIGKTGTLTMPTHPLYEDDPGFMNDKSELVFEYFPESQPSRVGLLGELFRKKEGVKRSYHPLSSLAAYGPLADYLLENNLNDDRPLPHGAHSSYYKFCKLNGLAVSIGLPLVNTMTVYHVAEEIRDETWPVKDFFYERKFKLPTVSGDKVWVIRERHPIYVRSYTKFKRDKDVLRNNLIHESSIDGIKLDYSHSAEVLSYMLQRNRNSTYPYYFTNMARL